MSITVDRPPRAPRLTGDYARDMATLYQYCRDLTRTVEQLYERTGARSDFVSDAVTTANTASTTANASQAGATIPTSGGAVTLNPANPLSSTVVNSTTATIVVAGHTRTGAASPLTGANVSPNVARGATYYVYYSDAGDAGGAQTYLASTSLATVTGTAGYRIIGAIYVAPQSYAGGSGGDSSGGNVAQQ